MIYSDSWLWPSESLAPSAPSYLTSASMPVFSCLCPLCVCRCPRLISTPPRGDGWPVHTSLCLKAASSRPPHFSSIITSLFLLTHPSLSSRQPPCLTPNTMVSTPYSAWWIAPRHFLPSAIEAPASVLYRHCSFCLICSQCSLPLALNCFTDYTIFILSVHFNSSLLIDFCFKETQQKKSLHLNTLLVSFKNKSELPERVF